MKDTNKLTQPSYTLCWYRKGCRAGHEQKPLCPTVDGEPVGDEHAKPQPDYPGETMLERARRLDRLDVWFPILYVRKDAYSKPTKYFGEQALALYKQLVEEEANNQYWWNKL